MKKLLTNKRKGYSKLNVTNTTSSLHPDYEAEDIGMDIDLNYSMNASYNYDSSSDDDNNNDNNNNNNNLVSSVSVTDTYLSDVFSSGIIHRIQYCVVPFYLFILIISILTTSLLTISAVDISVNLGMLVLVSFTIIGCVIGIYSLYEFGAIMDVINHFSVENNKYRENIDRLNCIGEVLQNDIDDCDNEINSLKRDGNDLDNSMKQYYNLRKELQDICDKYNDNNINSLHKETMDELLDNVNKQCNSLETICEDNEKAHLLSIFYSVQLYDYGLNNGINEKLYKKFLSYCNKNTRNKFKKCGGFKSMDINNNGYINIDIFEKMVHNVLQITINQSKNLSNSSIKIKGPLL